MDVRGTDDETGESWHCDALSESDDQSNLKFREENFTGRFFKSLHEFRSNGSFCDISIRIDGRTVQAHRIVLAASIPYFKAMFNSNMEHTWMENRSSEVEIKEEIAYTAFSAIIDYAYSGEITFNLQNVQQICIAASFLCINSLLNASIQFIIKHIDHRNVLEYKSFGKYFPVLDEHIANLINEEFLSIYKTERFLQLSYDEILKIVSNNELNVNEEKTVFEAMIAWVKADEENRKQHVCSLFEQIRLPFVSSEFIVDHIISEDLIKRCLRCRDVIDEAKDYHLLPQRRNLIQNHRIIKRSFTRRESPIIAIGCADGKIIFELYDTVKDQWRIYLTEIRQLKLRTSITLMKNKIYSIGGYENGVRTNNVEVFDLLERRWTQLASLNKKRSALSSVVLDDKIYSCGGYDGTATLSSAECYSPKTGRWSYISDMNKFRCSSAAVVCNGSIYVIGGHNGTAIFRSVERYDPVFNRWLLCKEMSKERCRLGATSLNGKIYVAGGFNGSNNDENSFESYDPRTDSWTSLAPMLMPRSRFSLIASGKKIFAIGGCELNNYTNSCEVYDVEANAWSYVASMSAKNNPTGVLLMDAAIPKE